MMGVGAQFEVARKLIETQVAFLFILSVATDAVLFDEGFVGFRGLGGAREAKAQGNEHAGWGKVTAKGHFG
jgi:hypothetical protein